MVLTGEMDQGAYQEHVLLFDNSVTKLPQSISFEYGSALPMAVATAGVWIFMRMGFLGSLIKEARGDFPHNGRS